MTAYAPFKGTLLDRRDAEEVERAREIAIAAGVQGIYVGNFLDGALRDATVATEDGGDILLLRGQDAIHGLAFFGARGNLILLGAEDIDPAAVARVVNGTGWAWRIVLGPAAVVRALVALEPRLPLVHRRQVYCGVRPQDVPAEQVRDDVRLAERGDQSRLLDAALDLNHADLQVNPRRVHRPWLRDSIKRRLKGKQTLVVGSVGAFLAKLDLGSRGPHGLMVEGVYTFPTERGRGLAAGLVATVARGASAPIVSLHVDADNAPARRAYARAGMSLMGECELMLRA